eukprot:UN26375
MNKPDQDLKTESPSMGRRVKSMPDFSKIDREAMIIETPLLAYQGIGERVTSFYKNLKHQSQAMLDQGQEPPEVVTKALESFEDGWNCALAWVVMQGVLPAFMFGYCTSVANIPQDDIQEDLNMSDDLFSTSNSLFCVGCVVGSFFAGWFSEKFGRKIFILFNDLLFIGGGAVFYFCDDKSMFIIGRFIVGIAGG